MPTKRPRRTAAEKLGLASVQGGYFTPTAAVVIEVLRSEADMMIEAEQERAAKAKQTGERE
jgi:hypothetical protein